MRSPEEMQPDAPARRDAPGAPAAFAPPPAPRSERRAWALACAIALLGAAALTAALAGWLGTARALAPPPLVVRAPTPAPSATREASTEGVVARVRPAIVAHPSASQQQLDASSMLDAPRVHISRRWMEGFYPIYATAERTFGVNWLLIASIHMQESAFSTAAGTYHGLNFAHCCGGPMQFNVTNGGPGVPSTWELVSDSYRYGVRPARYDHMTATHPSIYDDFDAIMAAAHLLSADGAEYPLDEAAWDAAYDYYGHDATGVSYADEVLARAIGWSQHGFCINCGVRASLVQAVYAAWGAPVLAALEAEEATAREAARAQAARRARSLPASGSATRRRPAR